MIKAEKIVPSRLSTPPNTTVMKVSTMLLAVVDR
jgi:hypothetical protein